jgi:protein-histidine N-methyltransferase
MLNCLAVDGRALVAAKKIYFGVGGGIPDFVNELRRRNAQFESVSDHVGGVGRSVLKVRHPAKLR